MEGVDSFVPEIVVQYQKALENAAAKGVEIKILIIVNPHNPLGTRNPI
jgi:1-aminocyclopropane-1-carboxylate synthase